MDEYSPSQSLILDQMEKGGSTTSRRSKQDEMSILHAIVTVPSARHEANGLLISKRHTAPLELTTTALQIHRFSMPGEPGLSVIQLI